jgi:S-adenosylmethionine hydrolase
LFPDRFGNLLTSLGCFQQKGEELIFSPWVGESVGGCFPSKKVRIQLENGDSIPLLTTFDEIPNGECRNSSSAATLIGSSGLLEIAAKGRSAAILLGLQSGAPLILTT